jgi:hypothetical protein
LQILTGIQLQILTDHKMLHHLWSLAAYNKRGGGRIAKTEAELTK